LAEESVDLVFKKLGISTPKCSTADVPLPGARSSASSAADWQSSGVADPMIGERLLRIYGSRSRELLTLCERDRRLLQTLNHSSKTLAGEIVFGFEKEGAQTLSDCLLRRTMSGLSSDLGISEVEDAVAVGQEFLGWDTARATKEVEDYHAYIHRFAVPKEFAYKRE
jgi:glycerol-3-phosphate dehydrogenase